MVNIMEQQGTLKHLIPKLLERGKASIQLNGSHIAIRVIDDTDRLLLITPVYKGKDYLPNSVRECLLPSFRGPVSDLNAFLTLDEEAFEISLNCQEHISQMRLRLLEEFSWLADEWRRILDDNDKKDLVHVRSR
jgi:hypothetical protein